MPQWPNLLSRLRRFNQDVAADGRVRIPKIPLPGDFGTHGTTFVLPLSIQGTVSLEAEPDLGCAEGFVSALI